MSGHAISLARPRTALPVRRLRRHASPAPAGVATLAPSLWAWPGYLVLAAATLFALVLPEAVTRARYVPLIASLVLLGMPHGAVDHLIPGWVRGRPLGARAMVRLLGAYVAVTLVGIAVWLLAPPVAVIGFFLITVVHWGTSELALLPPQTRPRAVALARGLVPVVVPAIASPAAFGAAIHALLAPFLAHPPMVVPTTGARVAGAVAVGLVCLPGAGQGRRARAELVGLVGFFSLVDPVFAIGCYFIAWHSWRHVVRLATLEPGAAARLAQGQRAAAIGRVLEAAIPCSALALAGLLGFGLLVAVHFGSAQAVVAVALALIAALTVPHTIVIAWLDRRTRRSADVSA